METTKLRRFAQYARRTLLELVAARLQLVLMPESAARRENLPAVKKLEQQIQDQGREQVIDRVAYTWFNRFCALRYMDVNRVNRMSVVSPLDGQFQPEILAEAKMGHIDEEMVLAATQVKVRALLDGTAPSPDPQQEAYRLLVVAACNFWQPAMPFLFERIADYTELLMPDDLLSGNSILSYTREAMTPDACQDVEVIGWLYQFYISEKKDSVFEGLKKNKKITPENIPAATQLFTPHWIVRYLVENSLGRMWLLNRPNSRLAGQMDYYIAPQEPVTDFLLIAKPEDIKLCDPACGSGHMLTYAFDLLYAIYEEEGADPAGIPEKILKYNLYGIEIDERAAELAAFALTMKARGEQRRFLNKRIQPNICVLRPVKIAPQDLDAYVVEVGRNLFTANLSTLLTQFEEADNFGSLIRPVAMDYAEIRRVLAEKGIGNQLLLEHVHRDVLCVLEQAEFLSQRYQAVITNPPYMGRKGMNSRLGLWLKREYPDSRLDLMTCFMDRCDDLAVDCGIWSMINLPSWMFLKSFETLREKLVETRSFLSLLHLGRGIFGSDFGSVAFVVSKQYLGSEYKGTYRRLFERQVEVRNPEVIQSIFLDKSFGAYSVSQSQFAKIPGTPIAYWIASPLIELFDKVKPMEDLADARQGLSTSDNEQFLRFYWEVSGGRSSFRSASDDEAENSGARWFPHNKGGAYRKWAGNYELLVDWECRGQRIKQEVIAKYPYLNGNPNFVVHDDGYYFRESISWSEIGHEAPVVRFYPKGFTFNIKGMSAFPYDENDTAAIMGFCNSCYVKAIGPALNPTMSFGIGNFKRLPAAIVRDKGMESNVKWLIATAKSDWDSYETSWDFSSSPLLQESHFRPELRICYQTLESHWTQMVLDTRRLEEENNHIFIQAYGLQGELIPDVPLSEITLTCNPHYRYGGNKFEQELEDLLRADTMREFISYAVGCMFGRYSLDKPGLILANQGETLAEYQQQVSESRFTPDADNVIPLLDGDWFPDDITGRFREFLRVAFGDEHYDENLRFIETALGKKGKPLLIRDFFLKEFYADHVKRYKKRPIYWLFSSPKGSFNALIYLHRYRPDTASVVLQYLRDFRSKLVSERDHQEQMSISTSASQGEKTKALKRIEELKKLLVELDDYEGDTLYPLASRQVQLDLDDGVKVNYAKLGAALKKIPGLDAKDDE